MKNLIFSGIFLSCLAVSHAQISNPKEQIYKGTFSNTEGNTGVLEAILYTINPSNIQGIGIFKYQNHVVYGVLYLYPNPSADGSATLNGSFQPSEIQYDLSKILRPNQTIIPKTVCFIFSDPIHQKEFVARQLRAIA